MAIAATFSATCGLTAAGTVTCWGQWSPPGIDGRPQVPVTRIIGGSQRFCALTRAGQGVCWGSDLDPGADPEYARRSPPGVVLTELEAGSWYLCGRTADGLTQCWGGLATIGEPPSLPMLGAPTVSAVNAGDRALEVRFTPPADGGVAITTYEYSLDGGTTWVPRVPAGTASPLLIGGLVNGTVYRVRIRAVNVVGPGKASAVVSATPGTVVFKAPKLIAVRGGTRRLFVSFLPPNRTGGSPIANYEYSLDGGVSWIARVPASTASPLVIRNVAADRSYEVRVRAVNATGPGPASNAITGRARA